MGVYVTVSAPLALTGTASSVSGPAPITASFTSAPSGGTPPYTYDWDFGDGTAHGTTQNAGHTYTAAGGYLATVTVTDAEAHAAAKTFSIAVAPGLTASAAVVPAAGNVPFLATFLATAAGGTPPYTYGWSFGDGGSGSGPSVTHTYLTAGSYTATLTVTDSSSPARTATAAVAATATVLPPIVSSMKKGASPFKIVVAGSNLQSGIQVFINGSQWTGVQYVSAAQIKITGGSSLKAIVPKGVPTLFRFLNPDGGETTVNWQY
jgi:PKD repeat protein